ncbi:MAG TPA: alpha/beta hydrolase-fold protein [Steroidobacteraceae bacterium]|nr:alpha/beta hydrolase-fold protein [Steroidobacteraceae bacterium]
MRYAQRETEREVTLSPQSPAAATVIWLHGLGADGWDFVPVVSELGLPDDLPVRFIFPHAPVRPVTVNAGYEMRAWYDIISFTPEGRADAAGLAEASQRVMDYVRAESEAGVPASRVVLAGFSQGGAVALFAGLRHPERLAGILALSTYLPFPEKLAADKSAANAQVPILMCHGREDPMVKLWMGSESRDLLGSQGYGVEWHDYPMQHELCIEELADVSRWLRARLG